MPPLFAISLPLMLISPYFSAAVTPFDDDGAAAAFDADAMPFRFSTLFRFFIFATATTDAADAADFRCRDDIFALPTSSLRHFFQR